MAKTGKTLMELASEIDARAKSKHDYVAKTEALELATVETSPGVFEPQLHVGQEAYRVNEVAHDQLGTFLEIPAPYYDRMRTEDPDLLCRNVNTWLRKSNGTKRMVRTLEGTARAFLSDKFRPIENEDLAATILPILLEGDRFEIISSEITDRRLYIKVVDSKVSRELAKTGNRFGDGQHKIVRIAAPAITISNSEVGMGALSIQAGIYDSFCTNLATFGERSMKKYHVGARHDILGDDVVAMLSQQTQNLSNAALMSQVQDVIRNAFNQERFNELCDRIDGTIEDRIETDTDVVKLVKLTGRKIGFSETEGKGVLQALIEGGDLSRFGLYNAVTAFSQKVESYDRASELERAGAAIVELPKNDWQVLINQSAN